MGSPLLREMWGCRDETPDSGTNQNACVFQGDADSVGGCSHSGHASIPHVVDRILFLFLRLVRNCPADGGGA